MTKNTAMKWSAFAGGVITAVTGGLAAGPVGALLGGLGAAAVGLPLLFHDAPAAKKKTAGKGQATDDEDPSP